MKTKSSKPSTVSYLYVHNIENDKRQSFEPGNIPDKHLWAYRHILAHECGSVSCGKTVYKVVFK